MIPLEPAGAPPAATGAVLADRYVLGALLGKGGMGRVYSARDRKLQRDVAVKLLGSASPDRDALRRFSREALAAGSLQHPNVVAVFDAGEDRGRPYLVTELLRGATLRSLLDQGPLSVERAASLAKQVAAGLAAAHDKGFTHRDLKPENIFITEDGWVKILDFGLVKLTESLQVTAEAGSTGVGRAIGTVGYMAPEQVRGQPVDPRADLFNFGLVLYEMLRGERAFKGNSSTETSYAILLRKPAPLPASVPRGLRRLVDRCLAKDRENRPVSAREVLALLEAVRSDWRWLSVRGSRRLPALALLVAGLAGIIFVLRLPPGARPWRRAPRPSTDSRVVAAPVGTVAILPFDSREATQFAALAEGVGDLLARDLTDAPLRAVESASVMRAVGGYGTNDIDRARSAAIQLGAKYFVLGRIENRQGDLVLEAVLHATDSAEPLIEAAARAKPAELLRLVRKLSDQLQGRHPTPKEFEDQLADLTRRTSGSLEAVQAWLEGERLVRRGRYEDSAGAFQKAVTADPEFALALYRLGLATEPVHPGQSEDALQRALHYGDRLSAAERTLVEAHLLLQRGWHAQARRLLESVTRDHPADAEGWMRLSEFEFHQGPVLGRSPQEAAGPLHQVLLLDPLNTEAIIHLADLAQLRGERAVVARLADRVLGLTDDPSNIAAFRLARSWARGDTAEHDEVLASLRVPGVPRWVILTAMVQTEWQMDGSSDPLTIAALAPYADGFQPMASANLLRGRPDAARRDFAAAIAANPSGDSAYYLPWIDSIDVIRVSPQQLAASRAAAQRFDATRDPTRAPAKQYLIGMLAVRAGDLESAENAAFALERMPSLEGSSITTDLALGLHARVLAARKKFAAALSLLDKQEVRIPMRFFPLYSRAGDNFFRASLLEALGRPQEALPLYDALEFYYQSNLAFLPAANLRKAAIYASLNDTAQSIKHFQAFAEMWKNCEPEQKPEVGRVQARLSELRAQAGTQAGK
jgi:tetratricopeptide (TPR) repeat protein